MTNNQENPRKEIKRLLAEDRLEELLEKAAQIHGHYCSYLALGVKATYAAFKGLKIGESLGMESIMVIAECNNCFVDGIQAVSGCTLGNNALIYKDLGKTAATFIKRKENEGLRLVVKSSEEWMKDVSLESSEAMALFDRALKKRENLSPEEEQRMKELWRKMSFRILRKPEDEIFEIKRVKPERLEYAPIFESIKCSVCGEDVMETRIRMKENRPVCISCADDDYWIVAGRGIHPNKMKNVK